MSEVVIYTKNNCMQCKMTKRFLSEHDIPFKERNINTNPDYIDYLKSRGFQAVPVVESNGNEPIAGFRPDVLKQLAM
ncbi:redoxin NrdH [Pediococcus siamensis]|uniref:redoxin NrdH n=1 Tax=Pediococcus siamensis TaxID=381829 RepID=UPI0039A2A818